MKADHSNISGETDCQNEVEYCFWQNEVYSKLKSCLFFKENLFKFMDNGIFIYSLFTWAKRWISLISKQYVEPYKLHPLPVADQILYWQPIFSKNVSDALIRLESYETRHDGRPNTKPPRSIMLGAIFKTFGKNIGLILFGFLILCVGNMSMVIFIKKILDTATGAQINIKLLFILVLSFVFVQFNIVIFLDHLNFYMYRIIHVIQYSFSITIFQHGLCYRRKYFNNINGCNYLNVCNNVLHSCSTDSECSKNPLYCPARRYQNKEINSRIFSFEFMDSYYISLFIESLVHLLQFIVTFTVGFYSISKIMPIKAWPLCTFCLTTTLFMIIVEILNTVILKHIYNLKDYRINKSREILSGLHLIYKMFIDDVAHNIITETRNNELVLVLLRFVLSFINRLLVIITVAFSLIYMMDNYVNNILELDDISQFKSSSTVSSLFVLIKICDAMLFIPDSIKFLTYSLISLIRVEYFMRTCSPNFYISDNKFTGSTNMSSEVPDVTNEIDKDVVVLYKDASFSWVNNRKDFANNNNEVYLNNVNFQLKRGEIAIITGNQGCGKSNFIKSVLGEMTLVSGCMAVVPLHTSMPIFYASQDIWLQQGTIRSNITFGYRFDEEIYNSVIKSVELEFDILSWEKGDSRVVYDNAHSLSGGQRVRMEMARAIYAYLIFSKVNKDYNSQCSFLMCLDGPFHGLDPYVSRLIFNNLFNSNTGLLLKDDLSIIITSTALVLDKICITKGEFGNLTLYKIENKSLKKLKDIVSNKKQASKESFSRMPNVCSPKEIIKICEPDRNDPVVRGEIIKGKYDDSLIIDPESKKTTRKFKESFKSYILYFKSTGFLFIFFVLFTLVYISFENAIFVLAGILGDDVMEIVVNVNTPFEIMSAYSTIRRLCNDTLDKLKILSVIIVLICLCANGILTYTCLRGCKRIHEYCIASIMNSSANVKIKKISSEVLTFLSSDIFMIDENFGPCLSSLLILFLGAIVQSFVIIYSFPYLTPVLCLGFFVIMNYIFKNFIHASKNLQISSLESLSRNNSVCDNAVSSSSIYRSFKKESNLMEDVVEYTDYCIRSWFYSKSFLSWASFVSKFVFLFIILTTLLVPVTVRSFKIITSFVGYYGLDLMTSVRIIFTFTNFVVNIAKIEMLMCSVQRFQCFIPPGTKCVFDKFRNVHEEDIVINSSKLKDQVNKKMLLKKRVLEFKETKPNLIKRMMYRPKINIIDITKYLPPEHNGVVLKDVCVYTSSQMNKEGLILNNINASPSKSDIIGIIGRTGAGKTTLLSVLQNTVRHRSGQVLLDGRDLQDIPKSVIRHVIGVLPQLPFVFKGWTIRRFLDPRRLFTDDEINDALHKCGLLEFVNNLHGGRKLDTVIIPEDIDFKKTKEQSAKESFTHDEALTEDSFKSEDIMLSISQLRTLWFAKLFLCRHLYRMLIIDEPPSDNCSEDGSEVQDIGIPIYELLDKYFKHCTCFVTAHYANALRTCTSVWVMHNGKLIKTCKASEVSKNESISDLIEQLLNKYSKIY
uniref:(Subtelomeric) ABC-transporter protein family member, putative n=1 Tax=Theileria annulata TaxID=5874 RepID=A0A3B0MLB9_THEAN